MKKVIASGAEHGRQPGDPARGRARRPATGPTRRRRRRSSWGGGCSATAPVSSPAAAGPSGCALYAASWRSPTVSKNSPTAQTTTPASTTGHQAASSTRPDHAPARPRTTARRPARAKHPADDGAHADLGGRAAQHLGVPRVLLAAVVADRAAADVPRQPPAPDRDEPTSSQRRQRLPSSRAVPTSAAASATSTKPAPHVDVDDGDLVELTGAHRGHGHADHDRRHEPQRISTTPGR